MHDQPFDIDEGSAGTAGNIGSQHGTAAFLIGESGLRLLEWKLTRDAPVAQRLFEVVEGNLHNPVREQLWGSSGSVLAAIAMAEHTGDARWAGLVQRAVQALWDEMEPIDAAGGTWGSAGRERELSTPS